jgi:RNA polymerase sigma factor (sigma-70 family)
MPESPLAAIVGRLVRGLPRTDGTADAALLARFVGWRDEAAFELLVYRHGPMVRGLCRRVLRHEQDAEDAFQATFLALAKKAATVSGQSLAGWLYRVAFHAALKAKARSARRETTLPEMTSASAGAADNLHDRELRAVLDEEVLRLPERFRLPVVLCYLQGRSNSEAAASLGIPKGTVDSRLATARQRLRVRLVRRGFAPMIAGAAVEGALDAAELPGSVVRAVTKAAVAFLSKQAGVPAAAAVLAEGVLQTMYLTKIKWALAAALTLAVLGGGAGVATYEAVAGGQAPAVADKPKEPAAKPAAKAKRVDFVVITDVVNPQTAAGIRALLQQPAGLDKPIDNMQLRDALEYLTDKFGITIRIDPAAFARLGVEKPFDMYDQVVRLPVVRGMTVGQCLHDLLSQVKPDNGPGNVTYAVKGSQIVIVPPYLIPFPRTLTENGDLQTIYRPDIIEDQVQGEPVSIDVQNKSLAEVLHELADATGTNIVLDSRSKDAGQTPVTVTLQNVRLLPALRVLADMVDLQPTTIGNVYYVTNKQNADRLYWQEWLKPAPGSAAAKPTTPSQGK